MVSLAMEKQKQFKSVKDVGITVDFDTDYIVNTFSDMMYKLAVAQLNNCSDAYDVVQDVLLKIHIKNPVWNTSDHVKAWLIRAVINRCRDYNKNVNNANSVKLEDIYGIETENEDFELQEALANLPEKHRVTLYLHYYEGYQIKEISKILKVGESGIKKRLVKGREMLKNYLGNDI
ncbi:MAG: RNA polymerase sigma factor [Oscillospiraceae bacterium]|nr:RNA polymerase sigma factor [Oscillospiraceae bacterium]